MSFDAESVRHAYEAIASEYARTYADEFETNAFDCDVVLDAFAALPRGSRVVDLGCGPGQLAVRLADAGVAPVGLDFTPAMLRAARDRLPDLPLFCGDMLRLALRDRCCAGAVARFSIHNMPRARLPAVLAEMHRVLDHDGVLLIGTHAGKGERHIESVWNGQTESVLLTYYEVDELAELLDLAGFELSHVRRRPPLDHEHQADKIYLVARR